MKKHFQALLFISMLLVAMFALGAIGASAETEGYYTYSVSNGEATITGFDKSVTGEVVIPSTLGGYPVTSIGSWAFNGCSSLTSITIPDSVTSIGSGAFSGCNALTSVTIPDSVTSIGMRAFSGCSKLTSITIGSGVKSIGNYAFLGCDGLTSVTIGDSVTSIGENAFSYCSALTSVTIPDGVTSIGFQAFSDCALTSITIPDSVTSIGGYAFCGTPYYNDASNWENGVLYIDNCLIDAKGTLTGVYNIKEGTRVIAGYAVYGCSSLTSVTIPDSVTCIEYDAFGDCALASITIPDSVTSIGRGAFSGTPYYNDASNWENGVLYIDNCLIDAKDTLTGAYNIKEGTRIIAGSAFEDCIGLTSITIPDGVTSIGDETFRGCSALTSITIPDSVTSIGESVFCGCSALTEMTIPFVGKSRETDGVLGMMFGTQKEGSTAVSQDGNSYYIPSSLRKVTITDAAMLPGCVFQNCSMLKEINLNEGISSIGESTFYNCRSLTSIVIPESVTRINDSAFYMCSSLTSIAIPESATRIGGNVFSGCSKLTEITLPFLGTSRESAKVFGEMFDTKEFNESIKVNQGGKDYYIPSTIRKVTITNAPQISEHAFACCEMLTEINIKGAISSIGINTFYRCSGLTNVAIPDSVTSIADYAFFGCNGLTSFAIPNELTSIGNAAFYNCSKLTSIAIPDGVTVIGGNAFRDCFELKSIVIPEGVTSIGSRTFDGCEKVNKLVIPYKWIGKFDKEALRLSLTELTITSGTEIEDFAFSGFTKLTKVELPIELTRIGDSAFSECIAIETVNFDGTGDKWNAIKIESNNECLTNAKINIARYTYTFKNGDGSVMESGTILYGEAIPKTDKIPEKEGTAEFSYTFTGWEGYSDGMTITEDITFEPIFEATTNRYTYKFISGDEVISEVTADYGSVITAPELIPEREFPLIFSEWEGYSDGMTLTGDCEFHAAFKNRSFTVTPDSGEAVEVVYGDDYVLGFSEKPGQVFIGYFTAENGEGDMVTDSDGASLAPFRFESDITVYAYYAEDLLEKIKLIGDETVKPGNDAVYSVRFATANEVTELYVTVRLPEFIGINEVRAKDAVSVETVAAEADSEGFTKATFKCILSEEPTSFMEPTVPFEIVFSIGDGAEAFAIEILPESHMKGKADYSFSEVFSPEVTVRSFVPGDVTGDGEVTRSDLLRLAKYFSGFEVELDMDAADVTGDGEVTRSDLLRLAKYFSGFEVKLGE